VQPDCNNIWLLHHCRQAPVSRTITHRCANRGKPRTEKGKHRRSEFCPAGCRRQAQDEQIRVRPIRAGRSQPAQRAMGSDELGCISMRITAGKQLAVCKWRSSAVLRTTKDLKLARGRQDKKAAADLGASRRSYPAPLRTCHCPIGGPGPICRQCPVSTPLRLAPRRTRATKRAQQWSSSF